MSRKVMQIGSMEAHGGLYPSSTMMRDGICLGILMCLRWACGHVKDRTTLEIREDQNGPGCWYISTPGFREICPIGLFVKI